jgi:glycosyltransferase involved in cell wall biosynthesis
MNIPSISVIAPAYNEEAVLAEFCRRTAAVLKALTGSYEIILIDDGSTDKSLAVMQDIHKQDSHVKFISFSKNFGHAAALSAGIDHADGAVVAIMDADIQDPPEVLPEFFKKWQEGYQVIYGIRTKRKESFIKRGAYWAFYRLFKRLASLKDTPLDAGDFAVVDRSIILQLRALPERSRFLRGLRSWVGFKQCGVPYERAARFAGETKYSYRKLFKLAFDGIFSFSHVPLRLATIFGFIVAIIALVASIIILYLRLVLGVIGVSGFSTLIISLLFIGSIQLISVGILGEYIGRIYDEVKRRPIYIAKEKVGFSE